VNLNIKERKLIIKWFDTAMECSNLSDSDLKLHDKLLESIEEEMISNDPLAYPAKSVKESSDCSEEDYTYDMDTFSSDEKY